jgi:hypothetical protein
VMKSFTGPNPGRHAQESDAPLKEKHAPSGRISRIRGGVAVYKRRQTSGKREGTGACLGTSGLVNSLPSLDFHLL